MIDFFFFQAEDGIRDIGVTGVQTCALPDLPWHGATEMWALRVERKQSIGAMDEEELPLDIPQRRRVDRGYILRAHSNLATRSEERRVGKECRSRWSPYH